MSLPVSTTTIAVTRPAAPATEDPWGDGYDAPADRDDSSSPIASGVRAVIAPAGARGSSLGGESQSAEFVLKCDPVDLTYLDEVTDEVTGATYAVAWSVTVPAPAGLDHVTAGLNTTKGQTP